MARCSAIRRLLQRLTEAEVSPADTLHLARHIPSCTACRIVVAREKRLAKMLESIEDPLPVDADFARRVMDALPAEAPATSAVRARRRGLAIAGLGALAVLGSGALLRLAGSTSAGGTLLGLPRLTFEGFESPDDVLGGIVRFVVFVLARAGSGLEAALPEWHLGVVSAPSVLLSAVLALATLFALAVLAAGGASGIHAIPSALMRLLSDASGTPSRVAASGRPPRSSASTRRM